MFVYNTILSMYIYSKNNSFKKNYYFYLLIQKRIISSLGLFKISEYSTKLKITNVLFLFIYCSKSICKRQQENNLIISFLTIIIKLKLTKMLALLKLNGFNLKLTITLLQNFSRSGVIINILKYISLTLKF